MRAKFLYRNFLRPATLQIPETPIQDVIQSNADPLMHPMTVKRSKNSGILSDSQVSKVKHETKIS